MHGCKRTTAIYALNGAMLLAAAAHMTLALWGTDACALDRGWRSLATCTLLVALPLVLFVVGIVGIRAAHTANERLFAIYVAGMSTVMVAQTIGAAHALASRGSADMTAYDLWGAAYTSNRSAIVRFEKAFACCGFASLHDRAVPDDCATNSAFGFSTPCRPAAIAAVRTASAVMGAYGLALVALEAIVLIATSLLFVRVVAARTGHEIAQEPRVYRTASSY